MVWHVATALAPTRDTVAKPTVHYGQREALAYLVSRLPPSYVISRRILREVCRALCLPNCQCDVRLTLLYCIHF